MRPPRRHGDVVCRRGEKREKVSSDVQNVFVLLEPFFTAITLTENSSKPSSTMHLHINENQQQVVAGPAMVSSHVDRMSSMETQFPIFDDPSNSDISTEEFTEQSAPEHVRSSGSSRSSRSSQSSRRRRSSRPTQYTTLPSQTPPAATSAIMKLTHIRVFPDAKVTHKSDDRCCSVCSERLVDSFVLTRLPCGHIYHIGCIVPWLNRSCTCPDCRYELATSDRKFEAGREERMKGRKLASCGCPSYGFHSCIFPVENIEK